MYPGEEITQANAPEGPDAAGLGRRTGAGGGKATTTQRRPDTRVEGRVGRGRRRQGKRGNQQRSPGRSDRPLDTLVSPIACKTEDQLFTIATIATLEDLIRGSLGVQRHRLGEGSGEGLQTVPSLGRGGGGLGNRKLQTEEARSSGSRLRIIPENNELG